MWFDIIKADRPTAEDIERIKAVQYQSEEDKKKIKEYEQSEGEKEEREELIERLKLVLPSSISEGYAERTANLNAYSNIRDFKSFVELSEKSFKRDAATEKSLGLLNKVIESNDKVTIVKEPELKYGTIYGTVEIEGESGNTYNYDFQNDPEIFKDISFGSSEVAEHLSYYESHAPNIETERYIPMCLSCEGDLPVGDNIASMILGLLNDESTDIKVLEKAIYGDDMINWSALQEHINDFMNDIDLTKFVIEKFEE
jgi:hypothetical protein